MRKSIFSRAARLALTLALVLTLLAPTVSASEYYAIVDSFGKKARSASLDVACDLAAASALRKSCSKLTPRPARSSGNSSS